MGEHCDKCYDRAQRRDTYLSLGGEGEGVREGLPEGKPSWVLKSA